MRKINEWLIQKRWFRQLFGNHSYFTKITYCLVDGKWKKLSEFQLGEKITNLGGAWYSQVFCDCGNELSRTQSFTETREVGKETVVDYCCSHCKLIIHFNPDIIPGLIKCDENGIPF